MEELFESYERKNYFKNKRRLTKKLLTQQEALDLIEIAKVKIELAEEMILTYTDKTLDFIDNWIIHCGGFKTADEFIEYCKQEIEYRSWRINEDYLRYLK